MWEKEKIMFFNLSENYFPLTKGYSTGQLGNKYIYVNVWFIKTWLVPLTIPQTNVWFFPLGRSRLLSLTQPERYQSQSSTLYIFIFIQTSLVFYKPDSGRDTHTPLDRASYVTQTQSAFSVIYNVHESTSGRRRRV